MIPHSPDIFAQRSSNFMTYAMSRSIVRSGSIVLLACTAFTSHSVAATSDLNVVDDVALTSSDQEELKLFGPGVIGSLVDSKPVSDILDKMTGLDDAKQEYLYVAGDSKGKNVTVTTAKSNHNAGLPAGSPKVSWVRNIGSLTTNYIIASQDSITRPTSTDHGQGVTTIFNPAEPLVIAGVKPGTAKNTKITVKVYSVSDPTSVSHSGYLDVSYQDKGVYNVTVPAGKFQARLIRINYKGKIGPASVEDYCWYAYAPQKGVVAWIDREKISAFLFYNKSSKSAAVLK